MKTESELNEDLAKAIIQELKNQRDYWMGWLCHTQQIDGGFEGQKANEDQKLQKIIDGFST